MKILLIDDTRSPSDIKDEESTEQGTYQKYGQAVTVVKSAEEGIELLKHTYYDVVLLDHDLGSGATGMSVVSAMERGELVMPLKVRIVTANIIAGPIMLNILQRMRRDKLIQDCSWIKPFRG